MKILVDKELLGIFKSILNRNLTLVEWIEIESDDEFQTENYCGGFDGTENEFCFSYYDKERTEYWFQKSLLEIQKINDGKIIEFEIRLAE
jgi:hypothetical protein